jgi:hypothetical protein
MSKIDTEHLRVQVPSDITEIVKGYLESKGFPTEQVEKSQVLITHDVLVLAVRCSDAEGLAQVLRYFSEKFTFVDNLWEFQHAQVKLKDQVRRKISKNSLLQFVKGKTDAGEYDANEMISFFRCPFFINDEISLDFIDDLFLSSSLVEMRGSGRWNQQLAALESDERQFLKYKKMVADYLNL